MFDALAALWSEPRPADPPSPGTRDLLFGLAAMAVMVADAALQPGQVHRPLAVALSIFVGVLILLRLRWPLGAFLTAFGVGFSVEIVTTVQATGWEAPPSHALALILPFALCRWGAGWQMAVGFGVLLGIFGLAAALGDLRTPQEAIGSAVMLLFPAALGSTARFQSRSQAQALGRVKLEERERLARELHDTVAHHVSAIAIQAQAGRAVADRSPERALATLEVIEGAAKKTLEEMRDIVGALRSDGEHDLAPQKGLSDLPQLVAEAGAELSMEGDFSDLRPAAGSAIYRMVQEAITNAERNARNKTKVWVDLRGDGSAVTLRVRDDGDPTPVGARGRRGFGLLGLAERAALLGGRFEAGPDPAGGWCLEAELPRTGQRGT
ncbi:MAG: sensor histidine kinase [Acidobacteriota bacterium]